MILPKCAFRSIRSCAQRFSVKITPPHPGAGQPLYAVGDRRATIKTAYHGGDSIVQHLQGADLAIVRAGADGDWYAVLPAQTLFELMQDAALARQNSLPSESE